MKRLTHEVWGGAYELGDSCTPLQSFECRSNFGFTAPVGHLVDLYKNQQSGKNRRRREGSTHEKLHTVADCRPVVTMHCTFEGGDSVFRAGFHARVTAGLVVWAH